MKKTLIFNLFALICLTGCTKNGELINESYFEMPDCDVEISPMLSVDENIYSLSVIDNRYGEVRLHKYSGKAGDQIAIDYFPAYGYVLNHFEVNGMNIGSNISFTLGHENSAVEGIFEKAIKNTDYIVKTINNNSEGKAYFTYELNDFGLKVSAQVIDPLILNYGEIRYQDFVEIIVTKSNTTQWIENSTFSIACTSNAKGYIRKAVSKEMRSELVMIENNDDIRLSSCLKHVTAKEGYSGYDATIEISYDFIYTMLGFTKSNIQNNVCFNVALNNAESDITYNWNCYNNWFNPLSYILVS